MADEHNQNGPFIEHRCGLYHHAITPHTRVTHSLHVVQVVYVRRLRRVTERQIVYLHTYTVWQTCKAICAE